MMEGQGQQHCSGSGGLALVGATQNPNNSDSWLGLFGCVTGKEETCSDGGSGGKTTALEAVARG